MVVAGGAVVAALRALVRAAAERLVPAARVPWSRLALPPGRSVRVRVVLVPRAA